MQFSLPIYPGLTPDEIEQDVIPFLKQYRDHIFDLYTTSRVAPFYDDAMGGGFATQADADTALANAKYISKASEIELAFTFNNIHLPPTYENYRIFVDAYRPHYEEGWNVVTIPHTSWLRYGLKQEFPELAVKNTILHRVNTASDTARLFEEGFDLVVLDRSLLRDHDTLREIARMRVIMQQRLGRELYLSILTNENCEGGCPLQKEHHAYNCHRNKDGLPAYFSSPLGDVSPCKKKNEHGVLWALKSASLVHHPEEMAMLEDCVDIMKLHGRESKARFYESMALIRAVVDGTQPKDPILWALSQVTVKKANAWRRYVRRCKFDCWSCSRCEVLAHEIATSKVSRTIC